jgi:uncharacterized hydrophobic protein (TIGR00271 family)
MGTHRVGRVTSLRLIVPVALVDAVLTFLRGLDAVTNVVHLPRAALEPAGDVVLCDVAREEVSLVVERLSALGLYRDGSIALEAVDASVSLAAQVAMERAPGSPADAVLWEQVEQNVRESTDLSAAYVLFMAIATMIAAVGILTDSAVLIVGAMVVGPEFGPLAALCVAVVRRRPRVARESILALVVGFAIAIAASLTLTVVVRALDLAPSSAELADRSQTFFISHPDTYSVLVALLAGVAGMLSLQTAKSGALIGVLISVTTIPAAANVGVAAAYRDWNECRGAALQLAINLSMIVVAGVATLAVARWRHARRRVSRAGVTAPSRSSEPT